MSKTTQNFQFETINFAEYFRALNRFNEVHWYSEKELSSYELKGKIRIIIGAITEHYRGCIEDSFTEYRPFIGDSKAHGRLDAALNIAKQPKTARALFDKRRYLPEELREAMQHSGKAIAAHPIDQNEEVSKDFCYVYEERVTSYQMLTREELVRGIIFLIRKEKANALNLLACGQKLDGWDNLTAPSIAAYKNVLRINGLFPVYEYLRVQPD